jgi:hypothetical protein
MTPIEERRSLHANACGKGGYPAFNSKKEIGKQAKTLLKGQQCGAWTYLSCESVNRVGDSRGNGIFEPGSASDTKQHMERARQHDRVG